MIKKLLFLILCLCLIFPTVMAVNYSGDLTKTFAGLQYTNSNGAANEISGKFNSSSFRWVTDLNIVGRPASLAIYTVADQKIQALGVPFFLSDTTGTYATGTVNIGNGSNFYPGNTGTYYVFNFATYDTGTRTGVIDGKMDFPAGTNYIPSGVPVLPDASVPLGFARTATAGIPGGYIYTGYDDLVSISYTITQISGIGGTTLAQVTSTKNFANTLTSQVRVYKNPDTLLGQSLITSKTGTDILSILGQDYTLGLYVPVKTKIYNSTTYYFPVTAGTDIFNLSVSPTTSKINTALTATLSIDNSSGLDIIRAVDYHAYDSLNSKINFYEIGSTTKQLNYVKKSGIWYGWDTTTGDFTNNKGVTFPETVSISFTNTGNYTVGAYVYSGSTSQYVYEAIFPTQIQITDTVGTQKYNLLLQTTDATNSQFIPSPSYGVKNLLTNTWENTTGSSYDSSYNFKYNSGTPLSIWISKTGYYPTNFTTIVNGNNIVTTPLTPTTGLPIPASNVLYTNLQVMLKYTNDGITYYPTNNVRISVETFDPADPISKQYGNTNSEGVVYFSVLNQSQNHTQTYATVITAVVPNYKTVSKSVIPTGNLYTVNLWTQANQIIIPTNQPTLIPTTSIPTVTQTGIGGTVKNTTAAVCGAPNGNTNIVDIFKSNIACWGINDRFSQDLAFAALIILFCAFLMSKFGKGIGAIVGAAIGFVISLAANLIPIWVFFALVIIAGLIFGLKLYASDK